MTVVRKVVFFLLMILMLLVQTGCWSAVELNDRAFARVMLVDKTAEGIELSLGFPLPNRMAGQQGGGGGGGGAGGGKPEPFTFVTKTSNTLGDAYRQIQSDISRRITFGQLRNIVLGRQYAEDGLETFVDFIAREPHIHINANLFVTQGRARQFTQIPVTFERFPTEILTRYAKDHITVMVTIKDLLISLYHGGDLVIPMLAFGKHGAEQEPQSENWMGTNGAALIRGGRLAGTLNTEETRGAMWIMGELQDAEFDIPSPMDGKNISFIVDLTATRITSKVSGDEIRIQILCKANARLILTNSKIDLSNAYQLKRVERALNEDLEERIDTTLAAARRARTDAFRLGRYVEWRYPREWNTIQPEWRQRLATDVKVEPRVDIRVKWFGAARKPDWNRLNPGNGGKS